MKAIGIMTGRCEFLKFRKVEPEFVGRHFEKIEGSDPGGIHDIRIRRPSVQLRSGSGMSALSSFFAHVGSSYDVSPKEEIDERGLPYSAFPYESHGLALYGFREIFDSFF